MITGSALFSRMNLSVFRRARVRAFDPALDVDSASQSGLGKSENNSGKKLLHHNWCKCNLTIVESTKVLQDRRQISSILCIKRPPFGTQMGLSGRAF
jgi:hypothetical protein